MQLAVTLDHHVNLLGIFVTVIPQQAFLGIIEICFANFSDHIVFQNRTVQSAVRKNIRRTVSCQIRDESRIKEIKLRRFDGPRQEVIGIRAQIEDDIGFFQYRKPALGCIIRDADICGNVMDDRD